MIFIVLIALVVLVLFLPSWWAGAVLRRHSVERQDYPGTGGEFARHLLDRYGMGHVKVEVTDRGDHYDPRDKAVRLSPAYLDGRSLTAVTVAAHEVGHAIQDHKGYGPLAWRSRLVGMAQGAEKLGAGLMMFAPVLLLATRAPAGGLIMFLAGMMSFGAAALVHLVTLPVELDASYRRAMPILASGYLPKQDLAPARRILTACAFTYVAASLASMLNLWRWLAILRR
ncbi:zinc metallopeptidase [Thioalkalivibrio sulfidiphilus]|uniref:Peptidase, membrane zinc metallopeptidase, putative n=1 Tax=Thioalkalivibrio sulfidiphilus (strain HL-EbGR7) TaxID=396588 RepID=B8GPZ1_THISH|nr:zinc metallopeptidase [Thioalkalivibrio sulfidiphilus]ACL74138.1 peptidase, membrane zinc metallopeptidase, putative [Thioalkalivibrio sulfidiphilus HL-EbGr7]